MIEVNEALTRKIASLSRLELTDQEITQFTSQLKQILKHVEQIGEVDVKGVEPKIYGVDTEMLLRDDEVIPFATGADGKPKILQSAPEVLYDGYKVPPIL